MEDTYLKKQLPSIAIEILTINIFIFIKCTIFTEHILNKFNINE